MLQTIGNISTALRSSCCGIETLDSYRYGIPRFLFVLLDTIKEYFDTLIRGIAEGVIECPGSSSGGLPVALGHGIQPMAARARELRRIGVGGGDVFVRMWPRLRVVSCWTEGSAAMELERLRSLLPGCEIQPKGLLATEAAVSIPLGMRHTGVCAVLSSCLEFTDCESETLVPVHRLREGRRYEVVVSTGSGFLRYPLHDVVEVCGWYCRTPCLRFIGRANVVSDCVGEKVHAIQAERIRQTLSMQAGGGLTLFMLSPVREDERWGYGLFVEYAKEPPTCSRELAERCESMLAESFHYAHARALGQLRPVRLFEIECDADQAYVAFYLARGMRRGDIKSAALHPETGWEHRFRGTFHD